jgi:hypothetical protein
MDEQNMANEQAPAETPAEEIAGEVEAVVVPSSAESTPAA